jgi:acetyltransferase
VLEPLFYPKKLLIVGVSDKPGNLGRNIVANLADFRFDGELLLMGREPGVVLGHRIVTSYDDLPEGVDLAVMLVPARTVSGHLEACGRKGIRHVIIQSGGFQELGDEGLALAREALDTARRHGIRVQGPNCLGNTVTRAGLCTTFVPCPPLWRQGGVAIVTQSGGVGLSFLFDMASENIGLAQFASIGNKLDLDETDFVQAMATDDRVETVAMYLESIERGRAFFDAVRGCDKPVLVIKSGHTEAGSQAAFSHTAAVAADDAVLSAAIAQAGAIRVGEAAELIARMKGLQMPRIRGNRLAVISRTGGHAVIAADAAVQQGFVLPPLPPAFLGRVQSLHNSSLIKPRNPLDLGDLFDFNLYAEIMEAAAADPEIDAVLFMHEYLADARRHESRQLIPRAEQLAKRFDKPVAVVLFTDGQESAYLKKKHDYPFFTSVESALLGLGASLRVVQGHARRALPIPPPDDGIRAAATKVRAHAQAGRRTLLAEGYEVLAAAGIPAPRSVLARTPSDLAGVAAFPVAAKVISARAVHKSDAGGVVLGIGDAARLGATFDDLAGRFGPFGDGEGVLVQPMAAPGVEMLVGGLRDPSFGPMVVVGLGGVLVEVLRDTALRLAPIGPDEARAMIDGLRGRRVLDGVRGRPPADVDALVDLVVRVSLLMAECPEIAEMDLNPVIVGTGGASVVDVRIALQ